MLHTHVPAGHNEFVPMIDRVGTIGKIAVLGQNHRDYLLYASGTVAMMAGLESDFLSKLHLYLAEGMYTLRVHLQLYRNNPVPLWPCFPVAGKPTAFTTWAYAHRAYCLAKACACNDSNYWRAHYLAGWFAAGDQHGCDLLQHAYTVEEVAAARNFMECVLTTKGVQFEPGSPFNVLCRLLCGAGGTTAGTTAHTVALAASVSAATAHVLQP